MAGAQEPPLNSSDAKRIGRIIKNFVGDRLRRRQIIVPGYENEDLDNIATISETLRRVSDELEAVDSQFFANMCNQLHITPSTAYPMFQGIADEIFASGKNWGRIVAFLTFGSTLAVHCACREDMGIKFVDTIVEWIHNYMIEKLDSWMSKNGGWDGFLDFFDNGDNRQSSTGGFFVSALAGVGIGALLMMSLK